MSADTRKPSCWAISDGAAGNERQVLALAGALGFEPQVLQVRLRQPWGWLSPHLGLGASLGLSDRLGTPICTPWPDIAIGCGRKAALLTRCLRTWSKGHSFTVQILDPRISPSHFDVVVTPSHDHLRGSNVIETIGALNPVDDAWLERGRACFSQLQALPSPRTGVLIGASTSAASLDDHYYSRLMSAFEEQHAKRGGSFLATASRRTPRDRIPWLRAAFARWPGIFWAGPEDGENPYAGILAWSDRIVASPDSVNMISEACATGKPVSAFGSESLVGKLGQFHDCLKENGFLVDSESERPGRALRETSDVAAQIRMQLEQRNSNGPPR